jgi:hypothetical protein
MPLSTVPKIGDGSTLAYEDQASPGTFIECPWMIDMGEIGDDASTADATPLRSVDEVKIPGSPTSEDREYKFIDVPGDAAHEDFIDLAEAQTTVNMQTTLSNGRVFDYPAILSKPKWSTPTRGERIEVTVPYSKSGPMTKSATA